MAPEERIVIIWRGKRYYVPKHALELNRVVLPDACKTLILIRMWPQEHDGSYDLALGSAHNVSHLFTHLEGVVVARYLTASLAVEIT